jgi:hypothetical protein
VVEMVSRTAQDQAGPTRDADNEVLPYGIYLGIGSLVIIVAVAVAAATFPMGQPLERLSVLAATIAVFAAVVPDIGASLSVVVLGYLLFNGFLENEYGQLTWDGMTGLWRIGLLVSAVGLGLAGRQLYPSKRKGSHGA